MTLQFKILMWCLGISGVMIFLTAAAMLVVTLVDYHRQSEKETKETPNTITRLKGENE